jgi:hypothetical protein
MNSSLDFVPVVFPQKKSPLPVNRKEMSKCLKKMVRGRGFEPLRHFWH